jgi:hypothetical protein
LSEVKKHEDPEYLKARLADGWDSRDISRELHVSYKLVEIHMAKYKIPKNGQRPD